MVSEECLSRSGRHPQSNHPYPHRRTPPCNCVARARILRHPRRRLRMAQNRKSNCTSGATQAAPWWLFPDWML